MMTHDDRSEINATDLSLPRDCQFRIWSRAELRVEDVCAVLEGSHACLMFELLSNRGQRVSCDRLWSLMLREGVRRDTQSAAEAVMSEICRLRYTLGTKGILVSIDDTEPDKGFILSAVCKLSRNPPVEKRKRPHRVRRTHNPPTTEICRHRSSHAEPIDEIPYSFPERLERRTLCGGKK